MTDTLLPQAGLQGILKQRARILGQESAEMTSEQKYLEVVAFRLAEETYAIELEFVREVYAFRELTSVPCTPHFVLGIVSIRGQIISVIDLKEFFQLPSQMVGERDSLIVIRDQQMEFGIQADAILGECRIPESAIQPSLPTLDGIREEFLKGVTGDRLIILDGQKLLCDKKLVVHEEYK